MPRTYDPEFLRWVVELVRTGRPVRMVAAELGLAEATVYRWKGRTSSTVGPSRAPRPASAATWLRQTAHQGVGDRAGLG
jgi:transposase-like protein